MCTQHTASLKRLPQKVISLEKLNVLISIIYNYTAEASIFLPWGNTYILDKKLITSINIFKKENSTKCKMIY